MPPSIDTQRAFSTLKTFHGHIASVNGVIVLQDGTLLSWSMDKTIRRWSTDGTLLAIFHGHTEWVGGVLELSDGRLASWSFDQTIRFWQPDGTLLASLAGHEDNISGVCLLDNDRLLSWSWDNTLRLWDSNGTILAVLNGHIWTINGALVLPDGRLLSWSNDHTLRFWDADGKPLTTLVGHTDKVNGVLLLPEQKILSWSYDCTLRLWDADGESLSRWEGHTESVTGALIHPQGKILSWSDDATLILWDMTGQRLSTLIGHKNRIDGAFVLPDGRILSWAENSNLLLWDIDGRLLANLHTAAGYGKVNGVMNLPDLGFLTWSSDGTLGFCHTDERVPMLVREHSSSITNISLLSDGRLVSCSNDATLRLWDVDKLALNRMLSIGHYENVAGIHATSDGRVFTWSFCGTFRVWEVNDATVTSKLAYRGKVDRVFPLPDGRLHIRAFDSSEWILDDSDGSITKHEGEIPSIPDETDPDNHPAFALLKQRIKGFWYGITLRDGRLLACVGEEPALYLFDNDATVLATLIGHVTEIYHVLELPDGRLLSKNGANIVCLWTTEGVLIDHVKVDLPLTEIRLWFTRHNLDWHMFVQDFLYGLIDVGTDRCFLRHRYGVGMYQLETGEFITTFHADKIINAKAFLAEKQVLVLGCSEGEVIFMRLNHQSPQ